MKTYIGTIIIRAEPMSKRDWVDSQDMPYSSVPNDPGYKVFYDVDKFTWYPKSLFDACFREISQDEVKMLADKKGVVGRTIDE